MLSARDAHYVEVGLVDVGAVASTGHPVVDDELHHAIPGVAGKVIDVLARGALPFPVPRQAARGR